MDNEYLDQTVDAVGQPKPIVAIVGRPNVGKSTLFNRLIGEQRAIVEDVPGTTRDRLYGDADWNGRAFTLVDTGGLDDERDDLTRSVFAQAEAAIAEADAIVFLVDARDDPTSLERDIADLLRRSGKPVVLAANKADSARRRFDTVVYYELGLGEPFPISSVHGTGTGDLLDEIVARLPAVVEPQDEPDSLKLAIVGRPNVGKSSLVNAILGQERAIVSPIPGTTRDAIDSAITAHDQRVTLIDTAGIRRRGRIERGIEHYSVIRALRAISRCDIVLLLIDATEINAAQDSHIAGYAQEEGKGLIILVNKWDLVEKDGTTMYQFERRLREQFNFVPYARFLFISAKTGQRVPKVLDLAFEVREERRKRVSTGELNRVMEEALAEHQPRLERGKRLKLLYGTQADVDPPTFVFFVNDAKLLHFSYRRYLENRLRQAFGFEGTAIRLVFRDREREQEREGRAKAGRR